MEYKKLSMGGYNLHLIKTDKFKMCHIEVIFRNNVIIKDITKRIFLTKILCENNMNYPTRRKLLLRLEDLYNASIYSYTTKVGGCVTTSFSADFLNPMYTEKKLSKEVIRLLFDIIFNPLVRNNEFDVKTFNLIKSRVRDGINSVIENPARLSVINALSKLGDTASAYGNIGDLKDLEDITPENLHTYYQEMLANDYVDIFVVGDLDMKEIVDDIFEYSKFSVIKTHDVQMLVQNPKMREKKYLDEFRAAQSHVVLILNLNDLTEYERRYVAQLYNYILGGGSLKSKLYTKLRLDNSLCYSVNSFYQKYNSLIVITTGVDINAKDKAIYLIKECLKEMKNHITEDELNNAKELICSTLNYITDDVERIVDNYYYEYLNELDPLDERIKKYKDVTIEDIYALSKKISISINYTLQGGTHEQD